MNVLSNELVGKWIEWATKNSQRKMLDDLWLLSDYIGGRAVDIRKVVAVLDKMDQSKKDVKTVRRELGL